MKPRQLYLNHAGTSWPKPRAVSQAVEEAMEAPPSRWPQRFDEAHQAIAKFFGVGDREQILLTPGCTTALAIAIGDALIEKGQRVLTSQWEHHALHRPLLKLAATGIHLEYVPPQRSEATGGHVCPIDLDWLEQALSKQDVGLVAITAACNVTGELLPYEEVIQLAHRYGSMVLLDAAQIVGWQKLDLPCLDADMVAFGGHKGLQAPWGIGGLYLSERARMECTSASCALPVAGKANDNLAPRPGYCDVGSVDQFALAGLHAAIQMLGQTSVESHLANGRRQIQRIREGLQRIDGIRFFGPAEPGQAMPTLALAISGVSSSELASRFRQQGIIVGSGFQCAPLAHQTLGTEDTGLVRLSAGFGQPDKEINEVIEGLPRAIGDRH